MGLTLCGDVSSLDNYGLKTYKREMMIVYGVCLRLCLAARVFELLSHIFVPCPRSYLAYATLISTFYYYYYYYYMTSGCFV